MALPLLIAVTVGLVWLLSVGAAQVRAVDAARETARAVARGDDQAAAVARGERVAPDGSRVSVSAPATRSPRSSSAGSSGPGGLFARLPRSRSRPRRSPSPRSPVSDGRRARRGQPVAVSCLACSLLLGAALGVVAAMVQRPPGRPVGRRPGGAGGRAGLADGGDAVRRGAEVAAANGARLDAVAVAAARSRSR